MSCLQLPKVRDAFSTKKRPRNSPGTDAVDPRYHPRLTAKNAARSGARYREPPGLPTAYHRKASLRGDPPCAMLPPGLHHTPARLGALRRRPHHRERLLGFHYTLFFQIVKGGKAGTGSPSSPIFLHRTGAISSLHSTENGAILLKDKLRKETDP